MRKYFLALSVLVGINVYGIPIIGPYATPMSRQSIRFTSHFLYMNFNERWIAEDSVWVPLEGDSSYMAILSLWEAYYGFENIFTIRAQVQLHYQSQKLGEPATFYGIGDIIADAKWNIWGPARRELTYAGKLYPEFSTIVGVRLPTGAGKDTPTPVARWIGSRSVDLEIGGLVRVGNSIGAVHGTIGYWCNGVIGEDREDEVFYNFTVEGPKIFEKNYLVFLVELDGSKIGRYHYLAQVCPGIRFVITYGRGVRAGWRVEHEVAISASLPIPIEAEGGYRYKFAPYIGVSWTF